MQRISIRIKLLLLPLLGLAAAFMAAYCFLYWLLHLRLQVIPLKEDVLQVWIPIALASLFVYLLVRPRVHLLRLDRNDGKVRTLYYMVATALMVVPLLFLLPFLESATGTLTRLGFITDIDRQPAARYYKPDAYVLHESFTGVQGTVSYSGKNNQDLNFDLYLAIPMTADLGDTVQSPKAFLMKKYHEGHSSNLSDAERDAAWDRFWETSFARFENENWRFKYLERLGNTNARDEVVRAAKKSSLYHAGAPIVILLPHFEPFEKRNGDNLSHAGLSLGIGIAVWLIMILIPGIHQNKLKKFANAPTGNLQREWMNLRHSLQSFRTFPATATLIAINTFVFIGMVIMGLGFISFNTEDLLNLGAIYKPKVAEGEWWRLVSAMFLHGGLIHVAMNMVSLFLAGLFLEQLIGSRRFAISYLLTGIIAGCISIWWHETPVVSVGASGGVFGMYGVLLALVITKVFDPAMNKAMLIVLAATAGYSLLMGFLSKGIDNSAHLGGLIAGLPMGLLFSRQLKQQNPQGHNG